MTNDICTVHIWDKSRPNYGANSFVDRNGTNQIDFDNLGDAVTFMYNNSEPGVSRMIIRNNDGKDIPGDKIFGRLMKCLFG